MSSGEPPKEGRRRNSRQPEHEQERRGAAAAGRLFNDVAVALVVCLASRSLTDESRFSALPFQEPGAAAEVEALQLRGRDVTVAHGAHCVAWRVCLRGQATGDDGLWWSGASGSPHWARAPAPGATIAFVHAVLVGKPESNVPARNGRRLLVVSKAQCERCQEPVLRDDARSVTRRRGLLVRGHPDRRHRRCAIVLLGESEARRIRRHRSILGGLSAGRWACSSPRSFAAYAQRTTLRSSGPWPPHAMGPCRRIFFSSRRRHTRY